MQNYKIIKSGVKHIHNCTIGAGDLGFNSRVDQIKHSVANACYDNVATFLTNCVVQALGRGNWSRHS